LLLPVITDALTQLPEATQRVRLHLAADDIELVRTLMDAHPGIATCQLVADAAVAPGGFLLETELCNVDATLSARWKRLAASLGRSYEWIDHT
jgi:flagellar assembly protein FliH